MNRRGFILPLTVLLVLVLGISGMGFMNLDFLERRMTVGNIDNHGAFYLANAGLERAREVFKIDKTTLSWTPILNGSNAAYPTDTTYPADLCPVPARGCVIPPFQTTANPTISADTVPPESVDGPDFPFSGTFDQGLYDARAFNDSLEGTTTDVNQKLTFRAKGFVQGEQKLLEVTVQGISGLNLVNCVQSTPGETCPKQVGGSVTLENIEGHDSAFSQSPTCGVAICLEPPLTDPNNYYRLAANFPLTDRSATYTGTFQNDSYYAITSDATINSNLTNVVIFTTGSVTISGGPVLTNVTIVVLNDLTTHGNIAWTAFTLANGTRLPAIIAGNTIDFGSGSVTITGSIYSLHTVTFNPITVYGLIVGDDVQLQGNTLISDQNDPNTYALMPGFHYNDDQLTTAQSGSTWREIQ